MWMVTGMEEPVTDRVVCVLVRQPERRGFWTTPAPVASPERHFESGTVPTYLT